MKLTILPELRDFLPQPSLAERKALRADIAANGVRLPLITWNHKGREILIDGHNRHEIAKDLEIPFETRPSEFADIEEAKRFMLATQFQRRNLNKLQTALLRGQLYNASKGTRGGNRRSKVENGPLKNTAQAIGKETGVAVTTVKADGKLAEAAEKLGLIPAILSGDCTRTKDDILDEAFPKPPKTKTTTEEEKPKKKKKAPPTPEEQFEKAVDLLRDSLRAYATLTEEGKQQYQACCCEMVGAILGQDIAPEETTTKPHQEALPADVIEAEVVEDDETPIHEQEVPKRKQVSRGPIVINHEEGDR